MDRSEKNLCIKCNEGGNLLVCSENGCPLAIHEGCMGCPARFDDAGHFYCPYCLYKQAVAESRQAREYALARKKALLIFMDEEMMGSEKHLEENKRAEADGHDRSKVSPANANLTTCDDGKSRGSGDAILNQPIHVDVERQSSNAEEEKIQEEESDAFTGSEGQGPSLKMYEKQKIRNAEGKKIQEQERKTSATSTDQDPSLKMHEDKNCNPEEEQIQEEECETSSASTGEEPSPTVHDRAKRGIERSDQIDGDYETVSSRSKLVKLSDKNKLTTPTVNHPRRSSRRSSSALRTEKMASDNPDEEQIQEEECETSSASTGEEPSPTVHARAKRGIERSDQIDGDYEAVSSRSKLVKRSDKNKLTTPTINHPRRSSRRSSSALRTEKMLSDNPEEELIQEEECETSSASTSEDPSPTVHARAKRGIERSDQIDGDYETVSSQSKLVKRSDKNKLTTPTVDHPRRSSRRSSSALRTEKLLSDKVDASRSLKQPHQPLVKIANHTFSTGKRKRLLWREEEEEKLKAGVEKYSTEGNKNIPWTKILDFGQDVFDRTRTPSDLKDKWRNMMAK